MEEDQNNCMDLNEFDFEEPIGCENSIDGSLSDEDMQEVLSQDSSNE